MQHEKGKEIVQGRLFFCPAGHRRPIPAPRVFSGLLRPATAVVALATPPHGQRAGRPCLASTAQGRGGEGEAAPGFRDRRGKMGSSCADEGVLWVGGDT